MEKARQRKFKELELPEVSVIFSELMRFVSELSIK
jgi:hypothetical protein